jgi:hypothetical protein
VQFRCRGSRRESAVAQLFSLGIIECCEKIPIPFYFRGLLWSLCHAFLLASISVAATTSIVGDSSDPSACGRIFRIRPDRYYFAHTHE